MHRSALGLLGLALSATSALADPPPPVEFRSLCYWRDMRFSLGAIVCFTDTIGAQCAPTTDSGPIAWVIQNNLKDMCKSNAPTPAGTPSTPGR
jgi:hypothetical protein